MARVEWKSGGVREEMTEERKGKKEVVFLNKKKRKKEKKKNIRNKLKCNLFCELAVTTQVIN